MQGRKKGLQGKDDKGGISSRLFVQVDAELHELLNLLRVPGDACVMQRRAVRAHGAARNGRTMGLGCRDDVCCGASRRRWRGPYEACAVRARQHRQHHVAVLLYDAHMRLQPGVVTREGYNGGCSFKKNEGA